ncbi:bifunctional [glutamate--ammonia ligase]-adenylyl-L-tyrosine phosphorylase/[glutamate--ammonia-ligase] adenylyltransferase [Pelagerythrobacter sp.]|uniref:bifunctional [glutamate--ammonia ligase]-adenylyl-L-tyrosine phosphorylase/[glutamate--ammonia-ligase] adenylyltransferase n=1 Tax=Pelagerythrobacter sp. TaxID=2800702 RepID=UPI0035B4C55C
MTPDWPEAIARARANAPFLARALDRQPELEALLAEGDGEAALAWARQAGSGAGAEVALRRERLALAAALAVGDLAGAFPVARVMAELSVFADRALDRAIGEAIARRVEGAEPAGMIALALGKHGAGELNYSSDIDPILLYDPETLPRRERDEPGEAAQRYAREIVQMLSAQTAEGYVFRVDLRLRPASEVSPLAISTDAALSHYESSALAWERAAFIRARAAAGDVAPGEDFLAAIRPFVWRRSLDFGAIEEIGRLTSRIREQYSGPTEPRPGFNLKQGRGGIREIEFFAQAHQLIHGGRDRSLRVRSTRAALDALAAAGHIAAEDAALLGRSYDRLRTVEHRLQMLEDHQTHSLPAGEALDRAARLDGLDGGAALLAELTPLCAEVAARFDRLLGEQAEPGAKANEGGSLPARLERLGFDEPEALAERIASWSDGHIRALRSAAARASFDALLPRLLEAFAEAPDPRRALILWEELIAKASSAINLFRLLDARPGLLDQLVGVLTLAPPLAEELARRPELLDALIDRSALDLPGEVPELAAKMARGEAGDDYEHALDRIRVVTGETRFALGVQLIEGAHDPLAIAAALSRTAEAALDIAARTTEQDFAAKHGMVPGGELLVLGLGRLGGGALTHASDLDIVYLFTGDHGAESDGARPLGATLYFNRLAQRVSGALSVPTAQGALYEVDTRLRPQGAQGPLAVSLDSFARYQREDAWTWEHMALTRARPLYGSPDARAALESAIADVLRQPRDPATLRADVLKMRGEMAANKPPRGPLDAKLLRGGLVDLEFLLHYLQLRERACVFPDLGQAIACLAERGLVPEELAEAEAMMTRLLVAGRLLAPDLDPPSAAAGRALAGACGSEDIEALLRSLSDARHCVAEAWQATFDEKLETQA